MGSTPAMMYLDEVLAATKGACLQSHKREFSGVGTDSRQELNGQLFFALLGEKFDAHEFVKQAADNGAAGVVVHCSTPAIEALKSILTVILVKDTLKALQDLAYHWRVKNKFKVVGITGSNGKTTTKEFTHTIVARHFRTSASKGSFNNHWGVPLSLLNAAPDTQVVVQEMGMNHSGELTRLVQIAVPDIVVVTMVGQSHIGELGSKEKIAQAKEEIYLGSKDAIKIFNLDNEWTINMYERAKKTHPKDKIITFSAFRSADVSLRVTKMNDFRLQINGQIKGVTGEAQVQVIGRHNVVNLMASAAIGVALNIKPEDLWQDLGFCQGTWGRNQLVHLQNGAHVLFDGYNANPESMAALLKNLWELEVVGKKIVILGEMFELGKGAAQAHRELAELVARSNIDLVWFFGEHARDFEAGLKAENFAKTYYISNTYEEKLAQQIGSMIHPSDIAVIKGSRAMRMEQVLQQWQPVDFKNYGSK